MTVLVNFPFSYIHNIHVRYRTWLNNGQWGQWILMEINVKISSLSLDKGTDRPHVGE